ncbi:copper homeostasis protein CutC [Hymenobacter sp. UYAg731]
MTNCELLSSCACLKPQWLISLPTRCRPRCHRVQTSGSQASALAGQNQLAALVAQAARRISVMPGAGSIGSKNQALATRTGRGNFIPAPSSECRLTRPPGWFRPNGLR